MRTIIIKEVVKIEKLSRNTKNKNVVLEIIKKSSEHPTADIIYYEAKKELPKISLGTVYRNLSYLVSNKDIIKISIPDGPDRYDKTTYLHAHFFCTKCHKLEDIELGKIQKDLEDLQIPKHQIDKIDVLISGVCDNCKKQKE